LSPLKDFGEIRYTVLPLHEYYHV